MLADIRVDVSLVGALKQGGFKSKVKVPVNLGMRLR